MIPCLLLGLTVSCSTPGAIAPYIADDVCDASGDCDDDDACYVSGGACFTEYDAVCWTP